MIYLIAFNTTIIMVAIVDVARTTRRSTRGQRTGSIFPWWKR